MTGGCGCGAVRFEIDASRWSVRVLLPLHALPAPHRHGVVGVRAHRAGLAPLHPGEDRVRAWPPEGGFQKAFCGECGSRLFSESPDGG